MEDYSGKRERHRADATLRGVATYEHLEIDWAAHHIEAFRDPKPEAQPQKNKHLRKDSAACSIGENKHVWRDKVACCIGVTRDPEPEAQPQKNKHGWRDKATCYIGATTDPEPEAQPQKNRHDGRDIATGRTGDTPEPEPEAQPHSNFRLTASWDPESEAQNGNDNEQKFPDDVVNIIEARVRAAIPQRYYSNTLESERSSAQPPTIYTVPRQLAMGNPRAYTPLAVRIGFISLTDGWRSETPKKMETYKTCCVRRLITSRQQAAGPPASQDQDQPPASQNQDQPDAWTVAERRLLHECLDTLKRLVPRIRAAHDGITWTLSDSSDDLIATQSLHDGCFILHRLLKYARIARRVEKDNGGGGDDYDDDDWTLVFGQCWVWGFVTYDLLLLQNQIPFFIIQTLFELLKSSLDERDDILITGALELFRSLQPHGHADHGSPIACRDVHHLLHLFYLSISFPTSTPLRRHVLPSELPLWVTCATELKEAGVQLRARKHGAVSFLDMRFHRGVLEIPPLRLYDYSESMFRNLIAFEQTYPATPGHVTAYAIFMACLITTHEDMRLLHQRGILLNLMSSGERDATRFFSGISAQAHTASDLNYLAGMMEEVVRYQSGRWPRWRASLVRNYFSNPWVITSVAAAVFLLFLTVVQAFFAAYAYFKQPAS